MTLKFLLTLDETRSRNPDRKQQPPKIGRAERTFAKNLRQVAKHVGHLIDGFDPGNIDQLSTVQQVLGRYAEALGPWATHVTQRMHAEVNARDIDSWTSLGQSISRQLRHDILHTDIGVSLHALLDSQVTLIRSLPLEAAQRVHKLTLEGLETSARGAEIREEILRSGEVTQSRATLIARTETSRTASVLTQTRAMSAGSTHFQWMTSRDRDVRPMHKALNGHVFRWDDPPECDPGHRALPGQIFNCRCWPQAVLPE